MKFFITDMSVSKNPGPRYWFRVWFPKVAGLLVLGANCESERHGVDGSVASLPQPVYPAVTGVAKIVPP